MPRKSRKLTPFGLSFLDIMASGFGAVVLLFLIIKHNIEVNVPQVPAPPDLSEEVSLLEQEIEDAKAGLEDIRDAIASVDQESAAAEHLVRRIQGQIKETESEQDTPKEQTAADEILGLKAQIQELEEKKKQFTEKTQNTGEHTRAYAGQGRRQYLTGLNLGGERILILLDVSSSMLDETLVNIIRRRNMPERRKLAGAKKWRQATAIVEWLSAHFPGAGQYQIYLFNSEVTSAVAGSEGKWLKVDDMAQFNGAVAKVMGMSPEGGTSLEKAFIAVNQLRPLPDNLFLITDGLPTQGRRQPSSDAKVSGQERLKLFNDALHQLPDNIPVNVILLPMEGDPMAAHAFWRLAIQSRGSFISPAEDWP